MTVGEEGTTGFHLLGSGPDHRRITDALHDLFAGDGTIYLVVGFFTYNGYRAIREDIIAFLERSSENRLTVVVGPASDQFSPKIAQDLWGLDAAEQVDIYKYVRGLHAKLYLRDGPHPRLILGSANLTQVGFRYNLELGVEIVGADTTDHSIQPFLEWVRDLVERSEPIRRVDLLFPMPMLHSTINWTNKARLLPPRYVAKRLAPLFVLLLGVAILARII